MEQPSLALYKDFFQASPDGMCIADFETRVFVLANAVFCRMLGCSLDTIQKMTVLDIHPRQESFCVQDQFSGHCRNVVADNVAVLRKDGTLCYTDISYSLMQSGGRKYLIGVFRDSTVRKQHDRDALKKKNLESVGTLAGGIAHDFNNILAGILGNIELAQMVGGRAREVFPLLEKAKQSCLRARNITRQLLTFSKGGEPVKQVVPLHDVITDAVAFTLHGSTVNCDYKIPEELWQAEVDPGQIRQVLQHVLLNARHAMADGGTIEVDCENISNETDTGTSLLPGKKYVKINIVDHGSGIPEEHLDHIFEPYFSTRQMGHGMGLAICHSIITQHGGEITVQSEVAKGTVVSIYLPAFAAAVKDDEAHGAGEENKNLQEGRKATIMVMDDESMVREVTRELLEQFGHTVLLVENGYQAIEKYEENMANGQMIDLVIMDLTIPGSMGGEDAVKEILRIDPEARVIVSSGYSCDPIMAHCHRYGFQGAITKPFQLAELDKVVHGALN